MRLNQLYSSYYHARGKDGRDHLWISPYGENLLGKFSSLSWRHEFFVPHLGSFLSPASFAAWCTTGDESLRHSKIIQFRVPFKVWKDARLFSKFAQLSALRNQLLKKISQDEIKRLLNLTWLSYKIHQGGIKERLQDEDYCPVIKEMVRWLLLENPDRKPDWGMKFLDFSLPEARQTILDAINKWRHQELQEGNSAE